MKRAFGLFFLSLMMCTALLAQVDTGTITGSVRDSQGAGIASAAVSFVEASTNATFKTLTDGSGEYVSPPLRPGTYKTVAEAQGFKTQTRNTITLKIQDRLRIDFDMAVGSVSENVEVTSDIPIMQTETSSLGQVITSSADHRTSAQRTRLHPARNFKYWCRAHQFRHQRQ